MKRIICILLCMVLLLGLVPIMTFAYEEVISVSSCEGGEISVNLAASVDSLIVAGFKSNKLIDCALKKDCVPGNYCFSLIPCYTYKVFAWNSLQRPVCQPLEIKDDSSIVLREEKDVTLPTLDDSVAVALGAAVSEYAQASVALQQIQELFAGEEAFAAIKDNPDLYMQYSKMLSETIGLLQNVTPSLAALDAVAQNQIDEINDGISLISSAEVSLQSNDEVISWAENLSKQFDALEGNNRVQQLAKNMGCDVKTAYKALTTAQDVLYKRYTADANCYENWEKAMVAVKATSKVAFFVCATAATAGATTVAAVPAALTTGTVTAGGAAGIMVGAADVGIELGVDTAKIIIGGNAKGDKIIQQAEDKLKPVTDGLLLYSLCTVGIANKAERLAFLGDIGQRGKEIYDNITIKSDKDGNLKGDIISLDNSDSSAAAEVGKEKGLPPGEDLLDDSMETAVERIDNDYKKTKEELSQLLKDEGIIETDKDFNKLIKDFNDEVVEDVNNPDPNPNPNPNPPRRERIVEYYDLDTGELTGVTCYDSKGNTVWRRSYVKGKVSSFLTNEWDENGDRIETLIRYFQDPVTNIYTTQIDWIRKSKYIGGSYTNEKLLEEIDYNDNGTIGEHTYYDVAGNYHHKTYDSNGQISLDTTKYPDRVHQLSYYTSNDPNVSLDRIGHLQYEYEYPKIPENEMFVYIYTVRKEWTALKRSNYTDKCYEYGWHCDTWNGSYMEGSFELIYTEPMQD